MICDGSEGDDCDEVICAASQDELNQEDSEQNEVDGMKNSTGKMMHCEREVGDL